MGDRFWPWPMWVYPALSGGEPVNLTFRRNLAQYAGRAADHQYQVNSLTLPATMVIGDSPCEGTPAIEALRT
jgi:hypothetical protein